jgi:predicted MFS family arabinose efflux permease
MLAFVDTVTGFYVVEAVLGIAFGIYVGVDLALVVDVLPNPDDAGKDLGVFNMANALPQSAAPALGAILLAVGSADNQNYDLLLYSAGVAALIGALVVLPIKKVR